MDQGCELNRKRRGIDSSSAPTCSIQIIPGTLRPSDITCKPGGISGTGFSLWVFVLPGKNRTG
jgi:hypothetical protein